MLAVLAISDVWEDDGTWHLGGAIEGVALPPHPDFSGLRATPAELRALFARRGWRRVVAWQARQPMHRAQFEFCLKSAIENEANLLLHPQAGGDITDAPAYFGLVRSFIAIRERFPTASTQLSLLPVPPREAGAHGIAAARHRRAQLRLQPADRRRRTPGRRRAPPRQRPRPA